MSVIMSDDTSIKCIVVGDKNVGKSSFVATTYKHDFPAHFGGDNALGNYQIEIVYNNRSVPVHIYDTASPDASLDTFRYAAYEDADVVILCFSLVSRDTFETISTFWKSEIRRHRRNVPILLVGLKKDCRAAAAADGKNTSRFVFPDEGEPKAVEIGAASYLECSALLLDGVDAVMQSVVEVAFNKKPENERICVIS